MKAHRTLLVASSFLGTSLCSGITSAAPPECASTWSMAPQPGYTTTFRGVADEQGHLFWTECTTGSPSTCEAVATTSTGQKMWRVPFRPGFRALTVLGDLVLVSGSDGTVEARRVADGSLAWAHDLGQEAVRDRKLASPSGNLYGFVRQRDAIVISVLGGSQSWLVALGHDGGRRWDRVVNGRYDLAGADAGGRLYAAWVPSASSPGLASPSYVVLDGQGREITSIPRVAGQARDPNISFGMWTRLLGAPVVFDDHIAATIVSLTPPVNCPPGAPCAQPAPIPTVFASSPSGTPLWSLPVQELPSGYLQILLGARGILVPEAGALTELSAAGKRSVVCNLPLGVPLSSSPAAIVNDVLVAGGPRGVQAFRLPAGVALASHGWVSSAGGSLARDLAVR